MSQSGRLGPSISFISLLMSSFHELTLLYANRNHLKSASYACEYDLSDIPFRYLTTSSEKYGPDESGLGVLRYTFTPNTANTTLRRHLHEVHPEEYDEAVLQHNWKYRLSSDSTRNREHGVGEQVG
jgi:hypothetical protein